MKLTELTAAEVLKIIDGMHHADLIIRYNGQDLVIDVTQLIRQIIKAIESTK